jgi:pantetheine-phosphate adenylyltransferase
MKLFFPGSFDPFTIGHADIVNRAVAMGYEVVIGVGDNSSKTSWLTVYERVSAIEEAYSYEGSPVTVVSYTGLTADAAREAGCQAILRGIRNAADFEYEKNIADINRNVLMIETIFLNTLPQYSYVSSSMVREIMRHQDARCFVITSFQKYLEWKR